MNFLTTLAQKIFWCATALVDFVDSDVRLIPYVFRLARKINLTRFHIFHILFYPFALHDARKRVPWNMWLPGHAVSIEKDGYIHLGIVEGLSHDLIFDEKTNCFQFGFVVTMHTINISRKIIVPSNKIRISDKGVYYAIF